MGGKARKKKQAREAREKREFIEVDSEKKGVRRYLWGDCDIMVGLEKIEGDESVWHINIKTEGRSLTFEELTYIRSVVVPKDVIMIVFITDNKNPFIIDAMQVRFK